jgi:hypothetical protein
MKAAIVLDDWKLPVFRKRLSEAGFAYEDDGPGPGGSTTILSVVYAADQFVRLTGVVASSNAECTRKGRPRT